MRKTMIQNRFELLSLLFHNLTDSILNWMKNSEVMEGLGDGTFFYKKYIVTGGNN